MKGWEAAILIKCNMPKAETLEESHPQLAQPSSRRRAAGTTLKLPSTLTNETKPNQSIVANTTGHASFSAETVTTSGGSTECCNEGFPPRSVRIGWLSYQIKFSSNLIQLSFQSVQSFPASANQHSRQGILCGCQMDQCVSGVALDFWSHSVPR